jgi:chromate transporter
MSDATPGRVWELLRLFGKLGVIGFGGPTAHVALLEEETVTRRGWLDRRHFMDALAGTNLVPGPNSTEMAIHIGYLRAGVPGALTAGIAFIAPAFVLMLALSWAYFEYGAKPGTEAVFYGLKPVVIAIIAATVYRLGRSAVTDIPLLALFLAGFGLTLAIPGWEPLFLLAAGLIGVILYGRFFGSGARSLALPVVVILLAVAATRWDETLLDLSWLFLRTGGLLFGGGYVMIPLVEHDVVDGFGWLTRQEFLDGVALGQSTPGPIVITATFVGYGAAGWPGAVAATVAIFAPSFLFAVMVARFTHRLRDWEAGRNFLKGVSAAAVGAIFATAVTLGDEALVDVLTWAVCLGALGLAMQARVQAVYLLAAGALIGFLAEGGVF